MLNCNFSLTVNFLKIDSLLFHFEQFINFRILNLHERLSWKEINKNEADMYFGMLPQQAVKENVEIISGPPIISTKLLLFLDVDHNFHELQIEGSV